MGKKMCPLLMLATSMEGLKPMQRTGDEDIAKCKEDCAWWDGEQCSIAVIAKGVSIFNNCDYNR